MNQNMTAEERKIYYSAEATDQRIADAQQLISTLARLTGYRDGVWIELTQLKDESGLDKPRFVAAIGAHSDHVELQACEDEQHTYEIDGQPYCCIATTLN